MIITAHKSQDDERMEKIIGTSPYVTAVGVNVPKDFILYAKDEKGMRYGVMPVSEYKEAVIVKKRLAKNGEKNKQD